MERDTIHRILLSSGHDPAAEQLLNQLRRAGLSVQGRDQSAIGELTDTLASEPWHLIIAFSGNAHAPVTDILAHLQETRLDIPCIVIDNQPGLCPVSATLQQGAADVFALDFLLQHEAGQQHFIHRVRRELQQLDERREKRQLTVSLREIRQHYHRLLDHTSDPVVWLSDGLYQYCNKAWLDFLGYGQADDLLHTPFLDQVAEPDVEPVRSFLRAALNPETGTRPEEFCALKIRHRDGSTIPVEMECTVIHQQDERSLQVRLRPATGITDHRNATDEMAGRDLITGLPARKRMLDAITLQISRAVYEGETATLVVLELEDLNAVRSVMGRADSNLVLSDFTSEMRNCCPEEAHCGRISDSGFAVILSGQSGPESFLEQIPGLNRVLQRLLPDQLDCRLSAGTAVISGESADAEALLVRAQHNRVARLNQRADPSSVKRQHRQLDQLARALDGDGLTLVFQPIVSLREDEQERYEVRVRLHDGEQMIPAAEFLETAIQHGLGAKLDRHVLDKALDLLTDSDNQELRLFINITLNTITDGSLLNWLAGELRRRRLPARRLILQISEIDALSATREVESFCRHLHELDIGISIAHFGCAMDPLSYLKPVGAAYVKLDHSLLSGIDQDARQRDRLQHLVHDLHAQGILVIAPVVERMEMLPLLWQARVNFVQGNALREPSAALDFGFVQDQEITLDSPSGHSA